MGADLAGDAGRAELIATRFRARLSQRPPLLYAILDFDLIDAAQRRQLGEALLSAGVDVLQLRAKSVGPRELAALGAALLPTARSVGIPLLINDRVDVALALRADGVHLGASDLPAEVARRLLGEGRLLGVTAHGVAELDQLSGRTGIDYVGFGAIHATGTKSDAPAQGVAALTTAVARTRLPLVAIGGLTPERTIELGPCGMAGIAAASALSEPSRVPGAVAAFRAALASRPAVEGDR